MLKAVCKDTRAARSFRFTLSILDRIPGVKERVRFMRLAAGRGELSRHADITNKEAGTQDNCVLRLHLPLITHEDVVFESWDARGNRQQMHCGEEGLYMRASMRKVICCDALDQLRKIEAVKAIVTSLPDASELECSFSAYPQWFSEAVRRILEAVTKDGVAVFYQGDRRHRGRILSKATLMCNAAESIGSHLLWHKIVLRNHPSKINLYRPNYLHLMAFSASLKAGRPTRDVINYSETIYQNGMSIDAAIFAVRFAADATRTKVIHDPFCGRGTVLAVANSLGLDSVGFDISREQCALARKLRIELC